MMSKTTRYLLGGALMFTIMVVATLIGSLTREEPTDETKTSSLPAEVTVAEAVQLREDGAFILDVRQQDEWDEFHMPGASLIPLDQLSSRLTELPKDQEIVVVCRSGNRSASGRDLLLENGFTNVTSMAGGMTAWRDAGHPVE